MFCSVNMLNENDYKQSEEIRSTTFAENMESVLLSADVKNIRDKSFSFVPALHDDHFYYVCFNLWDNKVEVLDNNAKDVSMKAKYDKRPEKLVRPSFYKIQMSFVKKCMISDVICIKTQLKKLHELVNKLEHNLIY
ncbi:hypothetical protein HanRHA438_Chr13g0608451 [Helianthus annuus]|uniref:Ulp1 protease family, C-terminal catalytic domain-containing protein n=1 Tax=Helianthus annuus TaxID=4232 RepID=A0A9K3ELM1_HELAN|nr:hypothetical protein HanXRQr2_Chr13g0597891 [Helianthus annuus]KAJ0477611.1 hypothetical protein HanHA300_Chr13g0490511 [Helianthus annuus]KAJ0498442.1 hypothetical protein HanHA89_Chr13g0522641 [Helianthus annuus]KAJ0664455.1 hypothetical protein HanLR1_Chr13g0492601 [Helianthus annuus]KAJ0671909.1 hypothetical protein HanOQP8_Chr13g0490991 [Helianthus annuus]